MRALEIARRLAQLNDTEKASQAYTLALHNMDGQDPMAEMEAALYLLQFGQDYRIAYTVFLDLHRRGIFQEDVQSVLDQAFYAPNVKLMRSRYEKNCKLLEKYPYFFRKDFIPFDQLPVRFYPYDDGSFVPYYTAENCFGDYMNLKDKRITRNFFHDLENPILAEDVYSEYELEYLNDNVRASEDVGRENHVYLHYADWGMFCSHLVCLNLRQLLKSQKLVFLVEEERALYPIDFKERFGIDYSVFDLKPVRLREVTRMVWHTQLSSHNGGDFFNEVFDAHPNLIAMPSMMMSNVEARIAEIRDVLAQLPNIESAFATFTGWPHNVVEELFNMRGRTDKDILVALYMVDLRAVAGLDRSARIVPAVFFQPHFSDIICGLEVSENGRAVTYSLAYEHIRKSPIFQNFKYIKTFTPFRRLTTSHASTVRFMDGMAEYYKEEARNGGSAHVVTDAVSERVLNRTFMIDPEDRLYHDSILVRFEDGKLNPKATFTALAAFLDLPYSRSMESCTEGGVEKITPGNAVGFDTSSVYKKGEDMMSPSEGAYIEYFLRDAYQRYGYDFHYYDGQPVDMERVREWIKGFTMINHYMRKSWSEVFAKITVSEERLKEDPDAKEKVQADALKHFMDDLDPNRLKNSEILIGHVEFVNKNGQPLYMMPMLQLDPELLENPVYH